MIDFITPDWPVPKGIKALQTLRYPGVSKGSYSGLNLGAHVGDDPQAVLANRRLLGQLLPAAPLWLEQVHGTRVCNVDSETVFAPADGVVARNLRQVCVIMTADCLPVLFCNREGTVIGAAHAGWRGLLAGILENTILAMHEPGNRLLAWLGPAIGPSAFEVGAEVKEAFLQHDPGCATCFAPGLPGKYFADIYALARRRLSRYGVEAVFGGKACTYSQPEDFFSYRRDGDTGRMATLIWRE